MNSIIKLLLEHYLASDTFKRGLLAVPVAIAGALAASAGAKYYPDLCKPETINAIFNGLLYALGVFITSPTIKKAFAAHGASNDELVKLVKTVLDQAGVQAPTDPAPTAPAASAPTAGQTLKMIMLCGLLLGLGAGLRADTTTTTTARGFMATPSLLAQGALYQLQTNGTLTPTAESVAGMQYSFYWGTYTESTAGKIDFSPLVFLTPFSIGLSTGTGSTRPVYSVAAGYKYFGVSAAWNIGQGNPRPLVGLMASIPLDPLLNGLVWDLDGTAAKNFPGASF
jgi:hypothetical protein